MHPLAAAKGLSGPVSVNSTRYVPHERGTAIAWDRYEEFVRCHIVPAIGRVQLAKLSPQHVERMQSGMLAVKVDGTLRYKPRTVSHVKTVLHTALEDALRKGLIHR